MNIGDIEITAHEARSKSLPHLLVVFPCLNEEAYLEALVLQFVRSLQGWPVRFVIVDGKSGDRSVEIAHKLSKEYFQISFLENPKGLQSSAVNLAVSTFGQEADYLIRVDVHAKYPDNYCQMLVAEVEKKKADSVVVCMRSEGSNFFQKAAAMAQNSLLGNGGARHRNMGNEGCWIDHGHHALIRIDAFKKIGGYDEAFSHNEDAEFDFRLSAVGGKIWLTGKTQVVYFPRSTLLALFVQYFSYGFGRAQNIRKNKIHPKLRQMMPVFVAPAALLALLSPFVCYVAAFPLLLWTGLCLGFGLWLAYKEHKPGEALLSGVASMAMHMGWSFGFWRFVLLSKTKRFL